MSEHASPGLNSIRSRGLAEWLLIGVGGFVLFVGASQLFSRVADRVGVSVLSTAFAPAVTLYTDAPTETVLPTPLMPHTLSIPSLGIEAAVESVGTKPDGSMATPKQAAQVGWYMPGSKPGEAGNAVFAGHVNNSRTTAGVFEHLSKIRIGDAVTIADASGRSLAYVVVGVAQYPATDAPLESIFTKTGASQIVLITCDGEWDSAVHSFDKRFVVYASLQS